MHGLAVLQGSLWVVGGCGGGPSCIASYADVWIGGSGATSWDLSTAAASFGGRSGHGTHFLLQMFLFLLVISCIVSAHIVSSHS